MSKIRQNLQKACSVAGSVASKRSCIFLPRATFFFYILLLLIPGTTSATARAHTSPTSLVDQKFYPSKVCLESLSKHQGHVFSLRGGDGGWNWIPSGWNPFGYKVTKLGEQFLHFDGSLDSDIGRFLASLKSARKTRASLKAQWLEVVRASKEGQMMRVYRSLDELLEFSLSAGFID